MATRRKLTLEEAHARLADAEARLAAAEAEKRRLDALGVPPIEEVLKTAPRWWVLRYRLSMWRLNRAIARARRRL